MNIKDEANRLLNDLPATTIKFNKSVFANELFQIKKDQNLENNRQILYHIINELTEIPFCECKVNKLKWSDIKHNYQKHCSYSCSGTYNLENNKRAFKEKTGYEFPQQSPEVNKKRLLNNHYSEDVFNKLHNKEWLIDQNHNQGKTLNQIGRDLGIRGGVLRHYFKKFNIILKTPNISLGSFHKLIDKEWMYNNHITENKNIRTMSNELNVSELNIKKYLKKHNIEIRCKNLQLPKKVKSKLNDVNWLIEQHHTNKIPIHIIAKNFSISSGTVSTYFKKNNIEIIPHAEFRYDERFKDKDWLYDQHVNKRVSIRDLAKQLNIYEDTLSKKMKEFGIPIIKDDITPENRAKFYDKEWLREQHKTKSLKQIGNELGTSGNTIQVWFKKHGLKVKIHPKSQIERDVEELLKANNIRVECNIKGIIADRRELDLYLPDYNIAIELNGDYYHSEKFNKLSNHHLRKTILCEEKGIKLYQFFGWETDKKKHVVFSMIKNALNINETVDMNEIKIAEVKSDQIKNFINENHITEYVKSDVNIALFKNEEILSAMTFNNVNDNVYELTQNCDKIDLNILNSNKLLFNYFKKKYSKSLVYTHSDRRFHYHCDFEKIGFKRTGELPPRLILRDINGDSNDLSNRVWDCGHLVLLFKNFDY